MLTHGPSAVLSRLRRGGDDAGVVALMTSLFVMIMLVMSALVIDMGIARVTRRDAQNTADASALAAANALYLNTATPDFNGAVTAVKTYAADNLGVTDSQWASCSASSPLSYVPAGVSSCISFDDATDPKQVQVIVPYQHAQTVFGGVIGYKGLDIDALAQAQVDRLTKPQCSFCVLGTGSHALQNGNLTVVNEDIAMNGSATISANGGMVATGGTTYIQGTASPLSQVGDPKVTGAAQISDPLSYITLPPSDTPVYTTTKTNPCVDGPGFYGSVSLSGNTTCTLAAGLYTFTDPFSIAGGRTIIGNNVTLYFTCGTNGRVGTCAADSTPGRLDAQGSGGFTITAPTSGPRKGLAIVYDRTDTAALSMNGGSAWSVTGTIYAPAAKLTWAGSACASTSSTMVVVSDLTFNGNSCLKTTWSSDGNVPLPGGDTGLVL
ncbi:MAG: hypothetical protein QOE01_1657 [Actinomycetota bacterium]|nr:hypothetical protein [Actinomycetota bacterium]